jgi:hypothetical protein
MKKLFRIIVSFFIIAQFLFCSHGKRNENNLIEGDIHPELQNAISLVIDEAKEVMKTDEFFKDNFYLVRFFEYEDVDYVSIGVLGNFPLICTQFKDKSLYYDYDFNLMYYFNVNDKNVIIMDYPKNAENPYFKKKLIKSRIIPIFRTFDANKTFAGFQMRVLKTFLVCNNDDNPKLILNPKTILSPPYPSEVGLINIEVIDVN